MGEDGKLNEGFNDQRDIEQPKDDEKFGWFEELETGQFAFWVQPEFASVFEKTAEQCVADRNVKLAINFKEEKDGKCWYEVTVDSYAASFLFGMHFQHGAAFHKPDRD